MSKLPEEFADELEEFKDKKPQVPWDELTTRQKVVRVIRRLSYKSKQPSYFWGHMYNSGPDIYWPNHYFQLNSKDEIVYKDVIINYYEFQTPITYCSVGKAFKDSGIDSPLDQIENDSMMGCMLIVALDIEEAYDKAYSNAMKEIEELEEV